MNIVTVNQYPEKKVELFTPDNQSLGMVNEDELLDVQCQIAENNLTGYYIMFNGQKITINQNGELDNWPKNMLSHQQELFAKLFNLRKNKR